MEFQTRVPRERPSNRCSHPARRSVWRLGLRGFTAAVIGGLDNPAGAVVGGLALGVAEAMAGGYLATGMAEGVAYAVLVAALLARPTGLLRAVSVRRL